MKEDNEPLMVTIQCFTYNQEAYIRECLEGFVMQKTKFRFEAIVHDDASTDGTADIVREYAEKYPDIIKPIYEKENQYSKQDGSLDRIMDEHTKGKYIAVCEGDDYWIDSNKLQKQVDFLETNPNYNLVYTDVNVFHQKEKRMSKGFFEKGIYRRRKDTHKDIIMWGWFLAPCTWLYRNGMVKKPKTRDPNIFYGDIYVLLTLTEKGCIHYINEQTAVYRILEESASHSRDSLKKFTFWKKGRATRVSFAAKQSVGYRIKFMLFNDILAIKSLIQRKDFWQSHKYLSMLINEILLLL